MTKLHAINPEPPVSPDVIERLTEVCDWVRDDQVSSIAIAVVHRDGGVSTVWSRPPAIVTLLGAVERLKFRLAQAMDQ